MSLTRESLSCAGDVLPRPHGNCYWLAAGQVLAGEHPAKCGVAPLLACGVAQFVDLTEAEASLARGYDPSPALHTRHAITDFGLPTAAAMRATLDNIRTAVAAGRLVYLHCRAGIGRTGTVAACLLVDHGIEPEAALALLQRKWQVAGQRVHAHHTPETEAQRAFVKAWPVGR